MPHVAAIIGATAFNRMMCPRLAFMTSPAESMRRQPLRARLDFEQRSGVLFMFRAVGRGGDEHSIEALARESAARDLRGRQFDAAIRTSVIEKAADPTGAVVRD